MKNRIFLHFFLSPTDYGSLTLYLCTRFQNFTIMQNEIINLESIQEQWKKDILMVAVFNAFVTIEESRPAFLDKMIDARAQPIVANIKKAVTKAFRESPSIIFEGAEDVYDIQNYLEQLINHEFHNLKEMEREIIYCSNELHDFKDHWAWFEWEIISELLPQVPDNH